MSAHRVALLVSLIAVAGVAPCVGCASSRVPADASSMDGPSSGDADTSAVRSCVPENVPFPGFSSREIFLEGDRDSPHPSCLPARPKCLVLGLDGAPRPACDSFDVPCVEASEVAMFARCSCRCEAPAGQPTCACAADESCAVEFIGGPVGARRRQVQALTSIADVGRLGLYFEWPIRTISSSRPSRRTAATARRPRDRSGSRVPPCATGCVASERPEPLHLERAP